MSPALIEAIVIGAVKYGPQFAQEVIALFKKETVTVDEVEALFAKVKRFEDYGVQVTAPDLSSLPART